MNSQKMTCFWLVVLLVVLFCLLSSSSPHDCPITYTMKDEFGDEATILRKDGSVTIQCNGSFGRDNHIVIRTSSTYHSLRRPDSQLTIFANTSNDTYRKIFSPDQKIKCRCNKGADASTEITVGEILCDIKGKDECGRKKLCLINGEKGNKYCGSFFEDRHALGPPVITSAFKVCAEKKRHNDTIFYMWSLERDSAILHRASNYTKWPKGEALFTGNDQDFQIFCREMSKFWATEYGLRDIVGVVDEFTLRPQKVSDCEGRRVRCRLKGKSGEDREIQGSCRGGWRVKAVDEDLWKSQLSKLICTLGDNSMKWQYYLFPTIGRLTEDGRMCKWPKWINESDTPADAEKGCEKSVKFNYPPSVSGKTFIFGGPNATVPPFIPTSTPPTTINTSHSTPNTTIAFNSSSSTTASKTTTTTEANGKGLSTGALIGIIVGVTLLVLAFLIAWIIFWRHRRGKKSLPESTGREEESISITQTTPEPKHYE